MLLWFVLGFLSAYGLLFCLVGLKLMWTKSVKREAERMTEQQADEWLSDFMVMPKDDTLH
jgi:hypothetical protein